MSNLFAGVRGNLLTLSVIAAMAYGPSPHTPGLGRLERDLLRRTACEMGNERRSPPQLGYESQS
jgi:hypothetical protein